MGRKIEERRTKWDSQKYQQLSGGQLFVSTSQVVTLTKPSNRISVSLHGGAYAYNNAGRIYFISTVTFEDGTSSDIIKSDYGYGHTRFDKQEISNNYFNKKVVKVTNNITFSSLSDTHSSYFTVYN